MKQFFLRLFLFSFIFLTQSAAVRAETTSLSSTALCVQPWTYNFNFEGQAIAIEHCGRSDSGALDTAFRANKSGLLSVYYKVDHNTSLRLSAGGRTSYQTVKGNDVWRSSLEVVEGELVTLVADMGDQPFSGWTTPKGNVCNGFSGAGNLDVADLFTKIQNDGKTLISAQCWGDGYAYESFLKETYAKPKVNVTCTGSTKDCRDVTIEDMDFNDGAFFVAVEKVHQSACEELSIVSGNNGTVPSKVTFKARATDNMGDIQAYRFVFGDGKNLDTSHSQIDHTFESSGNFYAYVETKDSQGNWLRSQSCRVTATVKSVQIESHKSDCSYLSIVSGQHSQAPSTAKFNLAGHDNKGDIKAYRVDFGDGQKAESSSTREFEHRYEKAGTYTVRGEIKDSTDQWRSADVCKQTLYINTKPIEKQPETGTPTWFSLVALVGGLIAGAYPFIQGNKRLGK